MNLKQTLELAGGRAAVAKACCMSRQAVQQWIENNRLPLSDITGRTHYARIICELAQARGFDLTPLEVCPGAGQYMTAPQSQAA